MSDELGSHLEFIQISTSEIIAVKKQPPCIKLRNEHEIT
jgi:hypothetical protein